MKTEKEMVLIAEDDPVTSRLLRNILFQRGYAVRLVGDGDRAWSILSQPDSPRLVILDWMLPGKTGVEICNDLRKLNFKLPHYIIIITSRGEKSDIVRGLNSGADDYLIKPINGGELAARLEVGLRVLNLQRKLLRKVDELEDAMQHIKQLQGLLPICMHCHRIRNDADVWQRLEIYISEHSDATFSHSLCPECYRKYYSEFEMENENAPVESNVAADNSGSCH